MHLHNRVGFRNSQILEPYFGPVSECEVTVLASTPLLNRDGTFWELGKLRLVEQHEPKKSPSLFFKYVVYNCHMPLPNKPKDMLSLLGNNGHRCLTNPLCSHAMLAKIERVMPGKDYVSSIRGFWRVCSGCNFVLGRI